MVNWSRFFRRQPHVPTDAAGFRRVALQMLRDRFSGALFAEDDSDLGIRIDDDRFSLQSCYAIFRRDGLSASELRALIVEHFERLLADSSLTTGPEPLRWSEAAARLRLQIMPIEYLEQAPAPLLYRPLNDDVVAGVVVDRQDTYSYVREEDPFLWVQSSESVFDRAAQNLGDASTGIRMYKPASSDRMIAIAEGDGYDAARILVPSVRALLAEHLGESFFAGFPNRDFLACWARDSSAQAQTFMREKMRRDNAEEPYPLTPRVFIATASAIEPELIP